MTSHGLSEDEARLSVGPPRAEKRRRGRRAYLSGLAAEDSVAREYLGRGAREERRRFRARQGEIDLVMRDGATLVFVEVKKATSFERAAESLSARQMARIYGAAEEYLAQAPEDLMSDMRFDVALVDGQGAVRIVENAFGGA